MFILFSVFFLLCSFSLVAQSYKPPHLEKKGNVVQLVVKDKPFLALGRELHNSTVSGVAYMRPVWEQMKQKHVNTVLVPVFKWDFRFVSVGVV